MCGENPETRMEELVMWFDGAGDFMDDAGNLVECSAQEVAQLLDTTPQVAGKVMTAFDDLWERKTVLSDGRRRVVYRPIEEMI